MKKEQEEKDNVISLEERRLALASKEPPNGNWLSKLAEGTRFLASKKNQQDSFLGDYLLASDPKSMPAVLLGHELSDRNGGFRWHDPVRFSRDHEFYMTIEINDGNSSEVRDGGVEGDGSPEVPNQVHEID